MSMHVTNFCCLQSSAGVHAAINIGRLVVDVILYPFLPHCSGLCGIRWFSNVQDEIAQYCLYRTHATAIANIDGVVVDMNAVDSNIVILRLTAAAPPRAEVVKRLQDNGVLVCETHSPPPPQTRSLNIAGIVSSTTF